MEKLHLNFYELSLETQKELKQHIKDSYKISSKSCKLLAVNKRYYDKEVEKEVNELFEINNAGINIDIFDWMK